MVFGSPPENHRETSESHRGEDICTAAGRGKVGAVRHFLREDPTSVSKRERFGACRAHRGREPLHYAAYDGHVDVLEVLLGAKASVDAKSKDGRGPSWDGKLSFLKAAGEDDTEKKDTRE